MSDGDELRGRVLNIQRMSTEDGPGLRTTVFLKGCSLACSWCHNPESICSGSQTTWHPSRCIGCRGCADRCPEAAISYTDDGVCIDRKRCVGCGSCAEECPGAALEVLGQPWSVDALAAELARDRAYFEASDGGVSISGGEPTLQARFVAGLLDRCRALGLHVALDTCGQCGQARLLDLARRANLLLYDLKAVDAADHRRFTGHSNQLILDNLLALRDQLAASVHPPELWIRTPLIPGVTATEDNLRGIGGFLLEHELCSRVTRWELCAFNNLCREQYRRLGRTWEFAELGLMAEDELQRCVEWARSSGVDPAIVVPSGATRVEEGKQP
jgi:pyruvate formate lyase activating enzyme